MKLGVLPGAGGTQRLPRLVGPTVAKQMILTGEPLSAERAYDLGLVNELAEPGEAVPTALRLAGQLAAGAPLALAVGKELIDRGLDLDLEAGIAFEREAVAVLFSSRDREEGLKAFRDRRSPEFYGK
jgi:enoyl-CoA hydratase